MDAPLQHTNLGIAYLELGQDSFNAVDARTFLNLMDPFIRVLYLFENVESFLNVRRQPGM